MESSTVIAFRTLVMLACLIIVPLAAIFGSQFPDVVKTQLIDRFWPANDKQVADQPSRPEAPAFSAGAAPSWRNDASPAPAAGPGYATPGYANPAARPTVNPGFGDPSAGRPISPAPGPGVIADGFVRPAGGDLAMNPNAGLQGFDQAPAAFPAAGANPAPASAAGQCDRFTWMERKLREHGATYYLLESWVHQGERYRFFCKIAASNNPGHTQNFEATDTDPLRAMGRVVDQVEAWRSGRPQ